MSTRDDWRDGQIGRVLNGFLDRRARGEIAKPEELLRAHPDFADELRADLALLGDFAPPADTIAALIERGWLARPGDSTCAATLGPYQILELLGRGGMGIVLKAYEPQLDRLVALKIVRPELAGDAAATARFLREARAAAALRHPNIVTIYAVGEERDVRYIAMEYVGGVSLAHRIRCGGPLPADASHGLFRQLLCGLAAAHEHCLVHRDIKSANILLEQEAEAALQPAMAAIPTSARHASAVPSVACTASHLPLLKIADFGLARLLTAQTYATQTAMLAGTPEYMSPEQAGGLEPVDHRTDLYSAGVVLYEMLTGQTPFHAPTPTAVLQRILNQTPTHPRKANPHADPALASLALKLMAKRPEDRFPSAQAALAALGSGRPVTISSHVCRRRTVLTVLAVVFAVVSVAAGVWCLKPTRGGHMGIDAIARNATTAARVDPAANAATGMRIDPDAPKEITEARIDPTTHRQLQVRYGQDTEWRMFRKFPGPDSDPSVSVCLTLARAPRDAPYLIVGLAVSAGPARVLAFTRFGKFVWERQIHDTSGFAWPDCESPTAWGCSALAAGPVDDSGEDKIVAAVVEREYPTVLTILDPESGAQGPAFHHVGHLNSIRVVPGYFGPGKSAIVAIGINNKLDGFFDQPDVTSELPRATSDMVPVIMILDPSDMDEGVGPPALAGSPFRYLRGVRAYGFLNVPWPASHSTSKPVCGSVRLELRGAQTPAADHSYVEAVAFCENDAYNATLSFNSRLKLVNIKDDKGPKGDTHEFWDDRWRLIPIRSEPQ